VARQECYAPPVPGARIASGQGWRLRPSGWRWHNGLDIPSAAGTPILAVAPGTIAWIGHGVEPGSRGYGNTIVVRHGPDWLSVYAHCASIREDLGAAVAQGEQIATVGATGTTSGRPHLHLEVVRRWPLQYDDTASRYDARATLEALGIDTTDRLVWRACGRTAPPAPPTLAPPAPPAANAPGPRGAGSGAVVLILALAAVIIIEERGSRA
jgi:murein DD-endopeptidase MepM/ murein hydrolase activator NlpD